MMKFINFGKFKSNHCKNLYEDYLARISSYFKVKEINFKIKVDNPLFFEKIKDKIIFEIKNSYNIVFCEKGKIINSTEFSKNIETNLNNLNIIVGTSWGVPNFIYDYSKLNVSIGRLTMPHELVKVIASEQVYRAITIIKGEKYNK